ncbi:FG-GAP repeat domain-containing protein [Streptomyces huiliensis]|uniref:FG-GAP repeat domain-containing protein n=1 Tax=Streptomyces huiliensis TaxID=2876027 RepID=UPI0027E0AFC5|nr:VCBS repeat-containing protein [Streptomyces huiliensis]MBZ4319830.1 VCBS repeat-containing protein [Streptomyces huiliensis]
MPHVPGRSRGRALSRALTAATAVALAAVTAGTASADAPGPGSVPAVRPPAALAAKPDARISPDAPFLPLQAVRRDGGYYFYVPDGKGGLGPRKTVDGDWNAVKGATAVDHDRDGFAEGTYILDGRDEVGYFGKKSPRLVATDWGQYDSFFSPGTLGGSKESDILVRDRAGVLWLYLAKADGSLTGRKQVGPGWGQYTAITGRADLTGDGRTDIVARDRKGTLWLYKGTGDTARPFKSRTRVGDGWNQFNLLLGTGDVDLDGHPDLIARDGKGALWLYKGTGRASAPFKSRTLIGKSGWNQYRLLF